MIKYENDIMSKMAGASLRSYQCSRTMVHVGSSPKFLLWVFFDSSAHPTAIGTKEQGEILSYKNKGKKLAQAKTPNLKSGSLITWACHE